ncbi:2-amino-4-hydroxy-6-hydroxymethyldihydropteridine diphosphokinase [Brachymonas denitrificans]|uniref:2-amino-4-hydroxy-6- hydroxymethyldihydropteridine diphosphokinase n=1 Tax=Brachymonas denitrificans TaxID=28220 RepID=UPI002AFFB12B|nr:2-amino-4-hydroxy-6-hydroxymethyldihydropteridine diphosphokinase [Brachymonas denitrificans]
MAVVVRAYVALGANLGDAQGSVRAAMDQVARLPQTQLVAASSLYRTAPVDSSGPDYINAVMAVDTGLTAAELLQAMQQIELQAGRERPYRNAPRTLDLDLLMYGELVQEDAALTLPHPRMVQRAFVLVPLHEIAPERLTAEQLEAVADQGIVRIDEAR